MYLVIGNKTISKPLLDILKIVKESIRNGKLKELRQRDNNIRVSCPFHKDGLENKASCDIYIGSSNEVEYGWFHCFTCGEQGPFYKFVAECFDKSEDWAKNWLIENFADGIIEKSLDLEPIILNKKQTKEYLNENILNEFASYHPYMTKRKLSKEVCERFKVRYDTKSHCIVFPVWDENNNLVMLTRRSVLDKKFIIDKAKEKPIYLLNFIKKYGIKEVTIVESQINALTLWSWGIPAIATFGCGVTDKQAEILNRSGINHIFICFDGDDAGNHGTSKLINKLSKSILTDVIIMDPGKDVNDITYERFSELPILDSNEWKKRVYISEV